LDRPEIAAGEALAGLLRPGNAGSNTTADHISVLGQALRSLPAGYRPGPDNPQAPQILIRSDSAGATYGFAAACRTAGVGFFLGAVITAAVRAAVEVLTTSGGWYPAIEAGGGIRDGAWLAEATDLVDLSAWPTGTRLILRKERPHPGAQLRFTDSDGHRITGFFTDTPDGAIPGQLAGLELRHRQHARVEDRIRQAKATGLRNLPFNAFAANAAWLEIVMAATDLIAWAKLIGFTDHPDLARCSATGCCTSPPASPAAPDNYDYESTPPGAGPRRSPPPGSTSATRSPKTCHPDPTRRTTPPALESPPTRATPGTRHTQPRQSTPQAGHNRPRPANQTPAKNRG
jgi:hypothetical protein